MASFAEKQLAKYGWSEGMGLGKNNDGIREPLKAHKKSDKLGLGSNEHEDTHKHWWDVVYNKTVGNINVEEKDGEIAIDGNAAFDMKKERPSAVRGVFEESFVKTGTLTGDSYFQSGSDEEEEEEKAGKSKANGLLVDMSDAALLKLCGGKTGHKGARHGIKMSGKMARLEKAKTLEVSRKVVPAELSSNPVAYRDRQVNEEFEAVRTVRRESKHVNIMWSYGGSNADNFSEDVVGFKTNGDSNTVDIADNFSEVVDKKKRSKKRKGDIELNETVDDNFSEEAVSFCSQKAIGEKSSNEVNNNKVDESITNDEGDLVKSSKKKKKCNAPIDEEVRGTGNEEFSKSSKNKKKKKNLCAPDDIDKENSIISHENLDCTKSSKNKKKKNKKNLCDSENIHEDSKMSDENLDSSKPSKKKNKKNPSDSDIIDQDSILIDKNLDSTEPSKKKKKRKSDSHNIDEEDSKISDENLDSSKPSKKKKKNTSDDENTKISDENLDYNKSSKKKKNTSDSDNIESDIKPSKKNKQMCTADAVENVDGVRSDKKKSKKRKRDMEMTEAVCDNTVLEASAHSESKDSHNVETSPVLLDSSSKKKKSKKSKRTLAE